MGSIIDPGSGIASTVPAVALSPAVGPKKQVLVLYGDRVNTALLKKTYDNIGDDVEVIFKSIVDFQKELLAAPHANHYDMVIINAHGKNSLNQPQKRMGHVVNVAGDALSSIEAIKLVAKHTDKIFLDSCHSGGVLKDMIYDPEFRPENCAATIVTNTGSKYVSILYSGRSIATQLLRGDEDSLKEFILKNYSDTVGIRYSDGEIEKISAVKVVEVPEGNGEVLEPWSDIKRFVSQLGAFGWDRKEEISPFLNEEPSQEFKNMSLAMAACRGQAEKVEYWLSRGADINAELSAGGAPLLYLIALKGDASIVAEFLNIPGIEINKANNNGTTPFFAAAQNGHDDFIELLMDDPRTDINQARNGGVTPLLIAIKNGHDDVVDLLLPKLIAKQVLDNLSLVIKNGRSDIAEILLHQVYKKITSQAEENGEVSHVQDEENRKHNDALRILVQKCKTKGWAVSKEVDDWHIANKSSGIAP